MVKYARFIYLHSQQKQKNQCTYIFDRDFMTGHNEHAYMYLSNINIRDYKFNLLWKLLSDKKWQTIFFIKYFLKWILKDSKKMKKMSVQWNKKQMKLYSDEKLWNASFY